ncbi:ParA family protein, partial [Campylobacter sp. 2018MI27]|nr:ParA family protein [Campylobacter sp. 2018MI27]
LNQLIHTVMLVQSNFNPDLQIAGVLMPMLDSRTNIENQVVEDVKKYFGVTDYQTIVTRNVRLSEAPSYGLPIVDYDEKSKGAIEYQALAKEVLAAHASKEK